MMSAAMFFLVGFSAAWLVVAGLTIAALVRRGGPRWGLWLVARAGLLIWFGGVVASTFAEVRRWPVHELDRMHVVETAGKLVGFALLIVGLALQAWLRR